MELGASAAAAAAAAARCCCPLPIYEAATARAARSRVCQHGALGINLTKLRLVHAASRVVRTCLRARRQEDATMADEPEHEHAEKVATLSLKDLRALVKEAGLSSEDCIEKAQLRLRAAEAVERLLLPGAKLGSAVPAWPIYSATRCSPRKGRCRSTWRWAVRSTSCSTSQPTGAPPG
eukprot:scaffold66708_cov44-Phaeocystis_antarctica.AAC.2